MDHEEVKKAWELKVRASFDSSQTLLDFLGQTLESFSYRYLENAPIRISHDQFFIESCQNNMGIAFRSQHQAIKDGVKQLAKSVPPEAKPQVVSRLCLQVHQLSAEQGRITLSTQVNWGHPLYSISDTNKQEWREEFTWKDLGELRKGLPLKLEALCQIFN